MQSCAAKVLVVSPPSADFCSCYIETEVLVAVAPSLTERRGVLAWPDKSGSTQLDPLNLVGPRFIDYGPKGHHPSLGSADRRPHNPLGSPHNPLGSPHSPLGSAHLDAIQVSPFFDTLSNG